VAAAVDPTGSHMIVVSTAHKIQIVYTRSRVGLLRTIVTRSASDPLGISTMDPIRLYLRLLRQHSQGFGRWGDTKHVEQGLARLTHELSRHAREGLSLRGREESGVCVACARRPR
jgi:hypothetical protein